MGKSLQAIPAKQRLLILVGTCGPHTQASLGRKGIAARSLADEANVLGNGIAT